MASDMKKNIFRVTCSALLATLIIFPIAVFAYALLEPLPTEGGVYTELEEGYELTQYLEWLYKFALAAAAFLAVLMIVIGGIQMIVGGASETARSDGKKRIEQAIWGLLLAITAWLVLYSINPDLVKTGLTIPGITIEAPATNTVLEGNSKILTGSFNDPPIKQGICGGDSKNCTLDNNLLNKTKNLNAKLMNDIGQSKWQVTEAYPPTYTHESQCHNDGTCFDANFTNTSYATSDNITKFQNDASASGLKAVYEVKDKATYDSLKNSGIEPTLLQYNPDASASHFHVTNI